MLHTNVYRVNLGVLGGAEPSDAGPWASMRGAEGARAIQRRRAILAASSRSCRLRLCFCALQQKSLVPFAALVGALPCWRCLRMRFVNYFRVFVLR